MREILFRGKCKYNGKWMEGYLIPLADLDVFAKIPTANNEDCTPKERGGEK